MKQPVFLLATAIAAINLSCNSQSTTHQPAKEKTGTAIIGGGCESCELMYINMPGNISPVDTSAGWNEKGQKLLVKGTVCKKDGQTPAANVILYYWQTDNNGLYSPAAGMDEKTKRHGHIRGWMKTGQDGKYALYTIRPAAYPQTNNPEHIHIAVKEPAIANEYYIDDLVFDDDPLLTETTRKQMEKRGGSGILYPLTTGGLQTADHTIILGLNIPDYPDEE